MVRFNIRVDPSISGTRMRGWADGLRTNVHPYRAGRHGRFTEFRSFISGKSWREIAMESGGRGSTWTVRYVIFACMTQDNIRPRDALRMVRNLGMIYNTWPAPRTIERLRREQQLRDGIAHEQRADV